VQAAWLCSARVCAQASSLCARKVGGATCKGSAHAGKLAGLLPGSSREGPDMGQYLV
jgi:hypothetical protein